MWMITRTIQYPGFFTLEKSVTLSAENWMSLPVALRPLLDLANADGTPAGHE